MAQNSIGVSTKIRESFLVKAKKDFKQCIILVLLSFVYSKLIEVLEKFDGFISLILRIFLKINIYLLILVSIYCLVTSIANFKKHRTHKVLIGETK